jgi:hypothetical protein
MYNPSILVDGEKEASGHEKLQRDAEIVIVTSQETHIWIHGTHYTAVGEVSNNDDVSPGDLFFDDGSETGICQIDQVLSINESSGEDKPTVDFGLVYSEGERINEVAESPYSDAHSNMHVEQGIPIGYFTGLEDAAMGYMGPPVKLEKVETE